MKFLEVEGTRVAIVCWPVEGKTAGVRVVARQIRIPRGDAIERRMR